MCVIVVCVALKVCVSVNSSHTCHQVRSMMNNISVTLTKTRRAECVQVLAIKYVLEDWVFGTALSPLFLSSC